MVGTLASLDAHAREELAQARGGGGNELVDVAAVAEHFAAAGEDGDGVAKDALAETRDEALHRHRLLLGEPRGGGEDQDERVDAAAVAEGIDAGAVVPFGCRRSRRSRRPPRRGGRR